MTATPPDPQPGQTPSLTAGGVEPGDTPPAAAQTVESLGPAGPGTSAKGNRIGIAVVVAFVVLMALLFIVWAVVRAQDL